MSKTKIAIYGLSTETEKELSHLCESYDVVGLLDSYRLSGELYGQPIISLEQAVLMGIELIIVIARPGSCKAIAKKIGEFCRKNKIALLDIRGNDLLQASPVVYDFKNVRGYQYEDLMNRIEMADVVSFDLFDTLIIRTILSPSDVIALVDARLKEKGIFLQDFAEKRLAAEKQLSQTYAPKLDEIYKHVIADRKDLDAQELAQLEYETDSALLVPRKDMVRLLEETKKLGKKIYITTDSYYSREQIDDILLKNGITAHDAVMVSCEHKTGKTQQLYDELLKSAQTDKILHIGDDIAADVQSAEKRGLQAFRIYSGIELFDLSGGLGLSEHIHTLSDCIRVGMFIADIFNSPFQFEDEEKKIAVEDAFDIGYLLCAPMIMDFTYWFGQRVQSNKIKNIWFCARDGYLIQSIFSQMYPSAKSKYYLTSRIAAIRAGVENDADIAYVDGMKFSGKIEDNLRKRFGIDADTVSANDVDESAEGVMKYRAAILRAADMKRRNNRKYIEGLKVEKGEIAFFDFVAKGTDQMFTERFVENELKGLYFLQLEPDFMRDKNLKIEPFYTEEERETSAIFDNYYILETILTSPAPSVEEFDEDGNPVYADETRTEKDIACCMRAQAGILNYVDRYLKICPKTEREINKKLDEIFLGLLHHVAILDEDFLQLAVEDPFFNRTTNMGDIL